MATEIARRPVYAVLSTIGRVDISACLASLAAQSRPITRIVVVDQSLNLPLSDAPSVKEACAPWIERGVAYVQHEELGSSRGRNHGLDLLPQSGLVFFPDDDAVYDREFVRIVADEIERGASFASGAIYIDRSLKRGRLPGKLVTRSEITRANVLRSFCEATLMIQLEELRGKRFDENLGVGSGTAAGGDEGADLVVRLLQSGQTGTLNPRAKVFHPDKLESMNWDVAARGRSYARGRGVVLRRYKLGFAVKLREFVRPAMAIVVYAARFDFKNAFYYASLLSGKLEGFAFPSRQLESRNDMRAN